MPSTCSSMVVALFSLPSLCLDWFLDADDCFSYYAVSRAVQHLTRHCMAQVGVALEKAVVGAWELAIRAFQNG